MSFSACSHTPSPACRQVPVACAAAGLRERVLPLARQLLAERARSGRVRLDAHLLGEDLALWLGALSCPAAPRDPQDPQDLLDPRDLQGLQDLRGLRAGFRARHRVYAEHALSSADFLVLHHDCAGFLGRCLSERLAVMVPCASVQARQNAVSTALALPLHTAVLCVTEGCARPQDRPEAVRAPVAPPRWCLVALSPPGGGAVLAERFRCANRGARILVGEARLTVMSVERPVVPAGAQPYGLAPVAGRDIAPAVHRAAAAARLARFYGLEHLDARHLPPVLSGTGAGGAPTAAAGTAEGRTAAAAALAAAGHAAADERAAADGGPAARSRTAAADCLEPLRDTRRYGHLLETLRAYLVHNLSAASAARSLFIHRHTFTYRLRQIEDLTGLDLAHPFHRLRAELSLLARELAEPAGPSGGVAAREGPYGVGTAQE
ncbi:hypothetical protein GPA10_27925 [Streptomyces sp. p1417]|uniref:PucR C-terminal helix-turn-helix domain-containing protein n=1 Tax=Streptomyces typhae TaxID=2681492 RepID=A0A6L6X3T7_9ACTN|nr:helix-turn-helix domain-containing protein [Streptomyces typhae]MVO88488.1 hypothetical protein [Streptomyces typhae]